MVASGGCARTSPRAWGAELGARLRESRGLYVIGGLVTSTLFTLLALPTFYLLVHRLLERLSEPRRAADPPS